MSITSISDALKEKKATIMNIRILRIRIWSWAVPNSGKLFLSTNLIEANLADFMAADYYSFVPWRIVVSIILTLASYWKLTF